MTVEIDEATGLPELPEGHWWEVVEQKNVGHGIAWPAHYELRILKRIEIQPAQEYVNGGWGRRGTWVTPPVEHGTCEMGSTIVLNSDLDGAEPSPHGQMMTHYGSIREMDAAGRLTPDGLSYAARRLIKRMEDDRILAEKRAAAEAGTKSLLGAYPPKRLEVAK